MDEKEKQEQKQEQKQDRQGAAGNKPAGDTQPEQNAGQDAGQAADQAKAQADALAEYQKRLAELERREMALLLRERLHDRNMPKELADVISCADEKDIDAKLDILQKCGVGSAGANKDEGRGFIRVGAPGPKQDDKKDPYRAVMGLIR